MGIENKKIKQETKINRGSLNRAQWTPSISAVFESLPLSSSEIRSDGKHNFWNDHIERAIGKGKIIGTEEILSWAKRNERMSLIQRESIL